MAITTETPDTRGDGELTNGARLDEARQRPLALADAYEPGEYALADGVCHVYWEVPECCQALRDDIRLAVNGELSVAVSHTASPAPLEREAVAEIVAGCCTKMVRLFVVSQHNSACLEAADAIIAMTRGKT